MRELRTVMERAVTLAAGDQIDARDLLIDQMPGPTPGPTPGPMPGSTRGPMPGSTQGSTSRPAPAAAGNGHASAGTGTGDDDAGDGDGKARLEAALAAHRGNVTSAARALGTSRSQVRRLARRYGIDLDRYR